MHLFTSKIAQMEKYSFLLKALFLKISLTKPSKLTFISQRGRFLHDYKGKGVVHILCEIFRGRALLKMNDRSNVPISRQVKMNQWFRREFPKGTSSNMWTIPHLNYAIMMI